MITERTLRRWRRESLQHLNQKTAPISAAPGAHNVFSLQMDELHKRLLVLTQELMDQYLVRRDS